MSQLHDGSVRDQPNSVGIEFEGQSLSAVEGEPIIASLLRHGIDIVSRSIKYHRPRGAFCLSGTCGQCWVRVNDVPNRPACTTPVAQGMVVARQSGFPSPDYDLFRSIDIAFAHGLHHHALGTTPFAPVNACIQDMARHMAGMGVASQAPPPTSSRIQVRKVDALIVGGGAAGLGAARVLMARKDADTLLVERSPSLGGLWKTGLWDDPDASYLAFDASRMWLSTSALIVEATEHHDCPFAVLVRRHTATDDRLVRIRARALVFATGGYEQRPLFPDSDLPGHFAARGFSQLVSQHGVIPGTRIVVFDDSEEHEGLLLWKKLVGMKVNATCVMTSTSTNRDAADARIIRGYAVTRARGGRGIEAIVLEPVSGAAGSAKTLSCNTLVSARPRAPAYELVHQVGCRLEYDAASSGFQVGANPDTGETNVRNAYACGELTGARSPAAAFASGVRAGEAIARHALDKVAQAAGTT